MSSGVLLVYCFECNEWIVEMLYYFESKTFNVVLKYRLINFPLYLVSLATPAVALRDWSGLPVSLFRNVLVQIL